VKIDYTSDGRPGGLRADSILLRPATSADCDAIASIWFNGWRDGHLGNVPAAMHDHRRLIDFQRRVPTRLAETTVATTASNGASVVGFVMVNDDEIEQIYVDESARGSDVAAALLRNGEQLIFSRFAVAWLAVVAGNGRARRFYERNGWVDRGSLDYGAQIDGGTFNVPVRRYEKRSWSGR
jgi:ribosomal protein S18 acetylase RimI-like enzyme